MPALALQAQFRTRFIRTDGLFRHRRPVPTVSDARWSSGSTVAPNNEAESTSGTSLLCKRHKRPPPWTKRRRSTPLQTVPLDTQMSMPTHSLDLGQVFVRKSQKQCRASRHCERAAGAPARSDLRCRARRADNSSSDSVPGGRSKRKSPPTTASTMKLQCHSHCCKLSPHVCLVSFYWCFAEWTGSSRGSAETPWKHTFAKSIHQEH